MKKVGYNDCPDANCPHYEEDEYLGSEVIHCIYLDDDNKCIKKSRLMAEAEIKEPQMPDEPTMEEMLRALDAMYFEWFSNGPESMPIEGKHKEIYQAIRRRIERKVSREWVEQYLNAIKYCGRDGP